MINVATVHYLNPKWIDPQLRYLEANIDSPYRVFASLEGIDDPVLRSRFFAVSDVEGKHAEKLNSLAELITSQSEPDDVLLFVDGDAFPIRPLVPWIEKTLASYPLAAVRRDENLGDLQPHPCFCVTTVGFWSAIGGDWGRGTWTNSSGAEVTDVGGILLERLRAKGTDWYPLLRTNSKNPHPLWYAVYDRKIYHHGAGFRQKQSRIDYEIWPNRNLPPRTASDAPGLGAGIRKLLRQPSTITRLRPKHVALVREATSNTIAQRRRQGLWKRRLRYMEKTERQSNKMFDRLSRDPYFYRQLEG
ncbi:MAG TPA: hypothetical protein VEJ87_12375 [Acidimicrobiales bacterium]|nr:hypothetical protein [Acidimicrobiales bacterium]